MDQTVTYSMSLKWRERADAFLSTLSWDSTWDAMDRLILEVIDKRKPAIPAKRVSAATQVVSMEAM